MRRSISVLVIEDNPQDADAVVRALIKSTRASFQVDVASDLHEGLTALAEKSHDATLLDLGLPDSDDLTGLQRVTDTCPETAVVVLTGFDDEPTALAALNQGAQDFLLKEAFHSDALIRTVLHSVERLRLRRELEHANSVLEQRVSERTAQLEEFATGLGHELNQPLQAILGFSSVACSMVDASAADGELAELVHDISAQASHAGALVTRLRQLIRHQDVPTESISANKLVLGACELCKRTFEERGVVIQLEFSLDDLYIEADSTALHQVILNLLQNSLEAVKAVDSKMVSIKTFKSPEDMCVFEVADSGEGVSPDMRDSIFNAFKTTRTDGLGLGLAICRTIVERYQGSVEYEPRNPFGSIFRVLIPLATECPK